jgi:hypothetical protein
MGREITGAWRKSSYSDTNGNCVETASGNGAIMVRDAKDQGGAVLSVPSGAWQTFTDKLK